MGIAMAPEPQKQTITVAIINMEGERDPSLHEPIGVESVASRLQAEMPAVEPFIYDTQPELVRTGKVDTQKLARTIRQMASDPTRPFLLGLGVPIYSYEYVRSLLLQLEVDPPESPMTVVLGNSIATYTQPELIHRDFPYVSLVQGEGEETFAQIASSIAAGDPVQPFYGYDFPDLTQYVNPDRSLTQDIVDLGGSVKIEGSRGCDYGKCTFCSRCVSTGEDYRTIPETKVAQQMQQLLDEFNITRFEFTDEEAFGDVEATRRLVSVIRSSELPRVPFSASLRVEVFNQLHEEGLLSELVAIGLDKVFMGAEGGSDRYLRSIGKGQSVEEIRKALKLARETNVLTELGFITYAWKMDFDMLVENIEFLSEEGNLEFVSALCNHLAVRAGTNDEKQLLEYVRRGDIQGYDPAQKYSVNLSAYRDVPFMDPRVADSFNEVSTYVTKDARVYYALRTAVRSQLLDPEQAEVASDYLKKIKSLHLKKLRSSVGLEDGQGIEAERNSLIERLAQYADQHADDERFSTLKREVEVFIKEQQERHESTDEFIGSLVVAVDDRQRVLLVRPRGDEEWAFPGGNMREGEDPQDTLAREVDEELGATVEVVDMLPTIVSQGHTDGTVGYKPKLTLHHHRGKINPDEIDIINADHEIADIIWLPLDMLNPRNGPLRIKTRPNIPMIAQFMQDGIMDEPEAPVEQAVTVRRRKRIAVIPKPLNS